MRVALTGSLILLAVVLPQDTSRDTAVVKAAMQAVAIQEFAKTGSSNRKVSIAQRSMAVSETALRQLVLHGARGQWPSAAADRVRDANRQTLRFGAITLAGFESVNANASASLEASAPGYVDREAYVFVRIRMAAIHLWVVRLLQQDDGWRVLAAVPVAMS